MVAYESRKLTATEHRYPIHILELPMVTHVQHAFRHNCAEEPCLEHLCRRADDLTLTC